ncbi:MAG: preprotein translocase subunit SecA, partial [Bacteroidales bacterium]|nr:preprotein translocase subunit SecA [Bacteroidales bacterium]
MAFNRIISKLFGNKAQRDSKEMSPYVKKIQAVYPEIERLSNDELRSKSKEVEKRIHDYVSEEKNKINTLKEGIEDIDLEEREVIWEEIDKIEKEISDKFEVILEEVLPEAFSIMKDTARRFTQNEETVVTAT